MNILGIETSCDETAVCIVQAEGTIENPSFKVLGNALYSQVKIHAQYGGVFPMLAKREHSKNLIPLFKETLKKSGETGMTARGPSERVAVPFGLGPSEVGERGIPASPDFSPELRLKIQKILEREPELLKQFLEFIPTIEKPDIDLIAVTAGPGLEPALWVGINFALALGEIWNIPVMPTNHMEGHFLSPLLNTPLPSASPLKGRILRWMSNLSQKSEDRTPPLKGVPERRGMFFPALALLISGGHTELVVSQHWLDYKVIGQTRDDAVGEAFDKVARILGLPYPGGPEISKLAAEARKQKIAGDIKLPRPMMKTDDLDFSFSGLKTAVLYAVKKIPVLTDEIKLQLALEFENAVTEVLITKTKKALEKYLPKTLIIAGGVSANAHIRQSFENLVKKEFPDTTLLIPDLSLSTDNAVMIAIAGYCDFISGKKPSTNIQANGNLSL